VYRVLWGAAVAYSLLLVLSPAGAAWALVRDQVLGNLVYVTAVAVLLCRRGWRSSAVRWLAPLTFAVACYLVGNVYYYAREATTGIGFPSWADLFWLAAYPGFAAAVVIPLRDYGAGRLQMLLDLLIGAAAGAAVTLAAVAPLTRGLRLSDPAAVVALAYPVGDVLLVAAAAAALGLIGLGRGLYFNSVLVGAVVFTIADVIHANQLQRDAYVAGTWLDALWAWAVVVMVSGAWRSEPPPPERVSASRSSAWVVTEGALCALAVIVLDLGPGHAPAAVTMALVTLGLCGARAWLAFRDERRSAIWARQVHTDDLTGLMNRRGLYAALDGWLAEGARVGLALVDLDRFKEVNDTYGHHAGDALLDQVAQRFSEAAATLPQPHLVARLGGDEFAVAYTTGAVVTWPEPEAVLRRLLASLDEPVTTGEVSIHAQASMGYAEAPRDATGRSRLMTRADTAMYAAKVGGAPYRLFQPGDESRRRARLELVEALYSAVEREDLEVRYRPVCTVDGGIVALQAVVCWHPRGTAATSELTGPGAGSAARSRVLSLGAPERRAAPAGTAVLRLHEGEEPALGGVDEVGLLALADEHRLSDRVLHQTLSTISVDTLSWRAGHQVPPVMFALSPTQVRQRQVEKVLDAGLAESPLPRPTFVPTLSESVVDAHPEAATDLIKVHARTRLPRRSGRFRHPAPTTGLACCRGGRPQTGPRVRCRCRRRRARRADSRSTDRLGPRTGHHGRGSGCGHPPDRRGHRGCRRHLLPGPRVRTAADLCRGGPAACLQRHQVVRSGSGGFARGAASHP